MIGHILLGFLTLLLSTHDNQVISSPINTYTSYQYSTELQPDLADLWWTVDESRHEITFEFHVKTTGWIALGISPAGGMIGADIGLGWVDSTGQLHFEDRYATGPTQPVLDTNSSDWIGLRGREENGWTAIQFKRPLDSCDSMDVPIKSGTNILIYAYSMDDPVMNNGVATIRYHQNRRYTRMIPLRSYATPPAESKLNGLDYFEFKLNKYRIPSESTTYHCQVYKAPTNFPTRRHSIAYKTIIEKGNDDIVHHLLMYECGAHSVFNDNNLPSGLCDDIYQVLEPCTSNIATGWAVGGDLLVEYPKEAGYPVGGDFEIKYYMVQMHYDNPHRMTNRTDSSGIRFYLGNELRQHELGYLSLGTYAVSFGLVIPPKVDQFEIDAYCPAAATKVIPKEGITVFNAFPHTHLQGRSLWTKIIRNKKAVGYLFNAEAYDFNYQFANQFPKPIKLYPGDELATKCYYSTKNKSVVTLGGESTQDEMCLHMFTYYPRMKDLYGCMGFIATPAWERFLNSTGNLTYEMHRDTILNTDWSKQNLDRWQTFFRESPKYIFHGASGNMTMDSLEKNPQYEDLKAESCSGSDTDSGSSAIISFSFISMITISYFIHKL